MSSEDVDRDVGHGVPSTLDFVRGAGAIGARVYECRECGQRIRTTSAAREHTSCSSTRSCPACGRLGGRIDVSTALGRVDVCECGVHFDAGVSASGD